MVKGLFINKEQLENVVKANCDLRKVIIVNKSQGFYRYFLEQEDIEFKIEVYYTQKKGTTIKSNCENGKGIVQAIINSIEYKESIKADFSTSLSEGLFHSVLELLKQSPNVSVSEPEDKGNNGIIYRVTTNFGDYATLTYFKTTTKMRGSVKTSMKTQIRDSHYSK